MFDNKKHEVNCPSSHNMSAPNVKKQELEVSRSGHNMSVPSVTKQQGLEGSI